MVDLEVENYMLNYIKKHKYFFAIILIVILFFSFSLIITHDTSHYHRYLKILYGEEPWYGWDVARGIVFPLYLFISQKLFGINVQSMLIPMFIMYLIMLIFINKFILDVSKEWGKWRKRALYILNIIFILFNPLIFGYYHVLLTEFIGMTSSVVSCYIAWKLLDLSFFENKFKYVLATLYFAIVGVIMWHLKQPHFGTIIFPLGISILLSIIKEFKLRNIIQRLSILIVVFIFIIGSLNIWNGFLKSRGVNFNSDRNIDNILGHQIIKAMYYFEMVSDEEFTKIEDYKYLSTEEVDLAKNYEKDKISFKIINIRNSNNKIIDQDILKYDNDLSAKTASIYVAKSLFKHPVLLLNGYMIDYLALIDVYKTKWDANGNHWVTDELAGKDFNVELIPIGMNIYRTGTNIFYVADDYYDEIIQYEQSFNQSILSHMYSNVFNINNLILFKLSFLLLPFVLFGKIIFSIVSKKTKKQMKTTDDAIIIILSYCFLHCLLHVYSGAIVDRYLMPAYGPLLFAYSILLIQTFCYIANKIKHKKVRSKK